MVALEGTVAVIGCPNEFVLGRLDRPKGRQFIEGVLCEELGVKGLTVRCVLHRAPAALAEDAPGVQRLPLDADASVPAEDAGPAAPGTFVQQVAEAFDGKLLDE